jgi:Rrf2 family nitric oxide-sensitive transcriptional repressor
MASILRISEAVSLALHAMTFLASHRDRPYSTKEIAERLSVSEAHLSKVLQRLNKGHLVKSIRGPKGGFTVEGSADSINLLSVYECIEGEVPACDCLLSSPVCSGQGCIFGGLPAAVSGQFKNYLETTKISDFTHLW